MAKDCRQGQSLNAYVDGELKTAPAYRLEEHLRACGECRLELESLQKLQGLLRQGLQEHRVPAPLWSGVRARIEQGHPPGLLTSWIRQIWEAGWERPRRSFAHAVLAALFLLSIVYLLWESPAGRPPAETLSVAPGPGEVVVEALEPEPGFRAMVLTTSEQGLKVIWVVTREDL